MLSFKDLQEVLQPKAAGEKRFKDKHVADTIDYPLNDAEINKGTKKSPAKKKRIADSEEGKDAAVYEELEQDDLNNLMQYALDEDLDFYELTEEQLDELIGRLIKKGVKKVGGAIKGRVTTSGRADRLKKKAAAIKKKRDDKNSIRTNKQAIKTHKAGIKTDAQKAREKRRLNNSYEEMTPAQEKKRKLQATYGESWKAVMYATATKQAMSESVDLDEAQKMFMFKTKAEAEKKAKQIKGVMTQLGPKNFMVVTKDLTKVPSKAKMKFGKDKDVTPKGYGPNEELDESAAGIAQLKKAYEPLRDKKISLDNAKKLSAIMDKFADDKAMLIKLVKADIPFVSSKAVTILITKHNMKGAEINKMMKEGNAFGMALKAAKEKGDKTFVVAGVTYEVYESADLDEAPRRPKAPKIKFDDIMNRKKKPKTYQVDIDGSRATVTAANEKMAIQKAMTKLKINKKIKPLPKATVKVMEEVDLDEANYTYKAATFNGNTVVGTGSTEDDAIKDAKNKAKELGSTLRKQISMKKEDVDLDEAFKISATNQKLNDGSMVNISKDDASALNGLYNSLNPANAKTMIKKMMQDKKSYGEILAFAKQAM